MLKCLENLLFHSSVVFIFFENEMPVAYPSSHGPKGTREPR